jgi:TonB family protein
VHLPREQAEATLVDEQRPPPLARSNPGGNLSQPVMQAITEIQDLMGPADENVEPDLVTAKQKLDELREQRFDAMNAFEKTTLLNFYTNYYLTIVDYQGAIASFEEILTIEPLREDIRLRTLRPLGQLYSAEEQWQQSINRYDEWRDASLQENDLIYRGLAYAHYQLDQFEQSLPHWISYMDLKRAEGEELGRDDYSYLNGLYFTLGDFESALDVTKDMILLFNNPTDWNNLRTIYGTLDEDAPEVTPDVPGGTAAVDTQAESAFERAIVFATDGDFLPLVAIAPQYPTRAAQRGIEGWVLVAFTVNGEGNVIEDSISVVDAEPASIFDRSAIRATERFKFQPRVINGEVVHAPVFSISSDMR